jgi:hypothetical protein
MPDAFFALSAEDRASALSVVTSRSGRPAHLLEKDIWVVWALDVLFSSPFGSHLVFKGGTSLSKAYQAIRRFSEDIDVTYDIRELVPDLVGEHPEALPPTSSQAKKWWKEIKTKLPIWVTQTGLPVILQRLQETGVPAEAASDGDRLIIRYQPVAEGYRYVRPEVLVEFGARSTGEPCETMRIVCDAAPFMDDVSFPEASPRVMRVERTFWEKATAVHVFCRQGNIRGDRISRHWYDLAQLVIRGHAAGALKDRELALQVARHKGCFFAAKDADGAEIDYEVAVSGNLLLVPQGSALEALRADYAQMAGDGVLLDEAPAFDDILAACAELQNLANAATPP